MIGVGELIALGSLSAIGTGWTLAIRRERRRRRMWEAVAKSRGAVVHRFRSTWSHQPPIAIEEERGVAKVFAETYHEELSFARSGHTRVRAMFPQRAGPKFHLHKRGLLSSAAQVQRQLESGAEEKPSKFLQRFAIKSEEPARALSLWSPQARDIALTVLPDVDVRCDGAILQVRIKGRCRERARLEALLELGLELASADLYGRSALKALEDGVYHETQGDWTERTAPKVELHLPHRVLVGPVALDGKLTTVAYVKDAPTEIEDLEIVIEDGRASPQESVATLPELVHTRLRQIGDGRMHVGKDLRFIWNEIETDPEHLHGCAEVLASLVAGNADGVYR